ncbi:MAG: hypothetical protein V3U83_01545 [Acidobacteriota bacterium]
MPIMAIVATLAAAVMASVACHAASREQQTPRKPLPSPLPEKK